MLTGAAKQRLPPPSGSIAPTTISRPRGRAGSALRTNVVSSCRVARAANGASSEHPQTAASLATRALVLWAVARPTPADAGYSSSSSAMAAG